MTIARKIAKSLLDIKAVKLNTDEPFVWTSGWLSPVYCDTRLTISFPQIRNQIKSAFINIIKKLFPETNVIAGIATGAITYAALIADEMNLPMIYIRPKPKQHGLKNRIEGVLKPNAKVVIIEDIISTAKSSSEAIEAVKNSGANILGLLAIFSYQFKIAKDKLKNVDFQTLTDFETLINLALEHNYINQRQAKQIFLWHNDPQNWEKAIKRQQ